MAASLARIGISSGSRAIDFPDDSDFSRSFLLEGRDEVEIRRLFDRDLRQRLLHSAGESVTVEGGRDTVLLAPGELVRPEAARELIRKGTDLLALLARKTPSSQNRAEAAAAPRRLGRQEDPAGAEASDGTGAEDLGARPGAERRGRGIRAALRAVVLLVGAALAVAGGFVIGTEIQRTVAGRAELLGNRLIAGIVLLVIGLGAAIQAAVGSALRRSSIKRQLNSLHEFEGDRGEDHGTGNGGEEG